MQLHPVPAPGKERTSSSKARASKVANQRGDDGIDAEGNEVYDTNKPNSLRTGMSSGPQQTGTVYETNFDERS